MKVIDSQRAGWRGARSAWWIAWVIVGSLVAAACGSGEQVSPQLQALPTRTPVATSEIADERASAQVEIVSLAGAVDAFLLSAEEVSALDRIDLFSDEVISAAPGCFESTLQPDLLPLEMIADLRLTSMNLDIWRASVDTFPEGDLIQRVRDVLDTLEARLPLESPLRLCVIPFPQWRAPEEMGRGGISANVLGGTAVWLACAGGEACLDYVEAEVASGYAWAYQAQQIGALGSDLSLLDLVIWYGRADAFTRELYPDAELVWTDALEPAQEADLWDRMRDALETSYQDNPGFRNVDYFLYGSQNMSRYPAWGGVYIGSQIVRAYQERYPDVTIDALMALEPAELLAESGYDPAEQPA